MSDVRTIVIAHLKANGFDGLWSPHADCACEVSDLMPCEDCMSDCRPGYKRAGCDPECGMECEWHIVAEKPVSISDAGDERPDDCKFCGWPYPLCHLCSGKR